jgi:hypothetical protein
VFFKTALSKKSARSGLTVTGYTGLQDEQDFIVSLSHVYSKCIHPVYPVILCPRSPKGKPVFFAFRRIKINLGAAEEPDHIPYTLSDF